MNHTTRSIFESNLKAIDHAIQAHQKELTRVFDPNQLLSFLKVQLHKATSNEYVINLRHCLEKIYGISLEGERFFDQESYDFELQRLKNYITGDFVITDSSLMAHYRVIHNGTVDFNAHIELIDIDVPARFEIDISPIKREMENVHSLLLVIHSLRSVRRSLAQKLEESKAEEEPKAEAEERSKPTDFHAIVIEIDASNEPYDA